jgi:hypothetical protein
MEGAISEDVGALVVYVDGNTGYWVCSIENGSDIEYGTIHKG